MAKTNWQKLIDQRAKSGLTIGQAWYDTTNFKARGISVKEAARYAASMGYGLGEAWKGYGDLSKKQQIQAAPNLKQALQIAGPKLSQSELKQIAKTTGKDYENVLVKAVQGGTQLGSQVVNQYQKGAYTDPRLAMARQQLPGFAEAAGKYDPILQQISNAGRLDKGSSLFIGSKGSTSTVLPRSLTQGMRSPAAPAAPGGGGADLSTGTDGTGGGMNGTGDNTGLDLTIGDLGTGTEVATPEMPAMEQFDPISSEVQAKDPLQLAALGQSYIMDMIRAKQRKGKGRGDYRRSFRQATGMSPRSMLSILAGGGVNLA